MACRLSEAARFKRVAFQRFEDAEILLANDRTTGAAYLVGYSVECAFKSLLLARTPVSKHASLDRFFSGTMGHNLEALKLELRRRGVSWPDSLNPHFAIVRTWETDLRYASGVMRPREAKAYVDGAFNILHWVEGQV